MITITIANQKGGVGKTTTAVTLAHGLARREYQTLLVDLDGQGNVADCLEKLRQMVLQAAQRPKTRRPTRPTKASRQRRLESKRRRSHAKQSRRPPTPEE